MEVASNPNVLPHRDGLREGAAGRGRLAILALVFLPGQAALGGAEQRQTEAARPPVQAEKAPPADAGVRYQPGRHRDPFLNPLLVRKKAAVADEPEEDRGDHPPGIAGMSVAQVRFMGTSLRDRVYTAVFRGTDGRFYFLKENDKFFDGYLKRIDGDAVTLVRETRLRSGKVERQEILRQLRTP